MIHFHSVWYLWLGGTRRRRKTAGWEGGQSGCLSLQIPYPFLLYAQFSHMYSSTSSLPVRWYPWSVFIEEETKNLKGLHDNSQSHS